MAVQRKLPTKICKCAPAGPLKSRQLARSRLFLLHRAKKKERKRIKFHFPSPVQTTAHAQKVTCLDIGETGRVLVTGGHDRLVNLFAIGNDKSIQVSGGDPVVCEKR